MLPEENEDAPSTPQEIGGMQATGSAPAYDPLGSDGGEGERWDGFPDDGEDRAESATAELSPDDLELLARRRRQRAARWVAGCGCLTVLLLIAGAIGGFYYNRYREQMKDDFRRHYVNLGYDLIEQANVRIREPLTRNTLILATHIVIDADCVVDLAMRGEICDINAKLEGTVVYNGRVLNIAREARVKVLEANVEQLDLAGKVTELSGRQLSVIHR